MHQNAFGGIWLATSSGVFLMTEKEGVVVILTPLQGFALDRIRIFEDSDGNQDASSTWATKAR